LFDRLPENALPVRFGGEEFALLVPRCATRDAHRCAEQMRKDIEALRPGDIPITVSIGLSTNQQSPGMTLTQLIGNADRALYAAKAQGRNQVCA